MKKNPLLYFLLCLPLFFISCNKDKKDLQDACNKLQQLHAHPSISVTKGEEADVSAETLDGATYYWSGPNNFQSYSQFNVVNSSANFSNRGWYYVNISYDGCNDSRYDSMYVDVKFPQGTAPCTPADNTATFSGPLLLGDQSYSYASFAQGISGYEVTANSPNGDMNITMSEYWSTHELEDGVYYTINTPIPDYADIDKVFISNVNQSIYWAAEADKAVYVSHANGKKRITFCGIQFTGDWGGTAYHTTVDAQLTQQ